MEKMILKVLSFDVKIKLANNQHYAMKNKSCITNLLQTKKLILNNFENLHSTYVVYLDLSSAFDTVSHSILFQWLINCSSLEPSIIAWIYYYLTNRKAILKFNDDFSDPIPLSQSVLQGSPFSALLFT